MINQKYLIISFTNKEIERIFSKISIDETSGCWNWKAATLKYRGYGVINYHGKTELVHRLLYAWLVEPLPMGRGKSIPVLDHVVCDNVTCCNPFHLSLGPQKINVLRGESPMAINARKTHCIHGHLLPTEPNELWGKDRQGRRCVICRRINANRRRKNKLST